MNLSQNYLWFQQYRSIYLFMGLAFLWVSKGVLTEAECYVFKLFQQLRELHTVSDIFQSNTFNS